MSRCRTRNLAPVHSRRGRECDCEFRTRIGLMRPWAEFCGLRMISDEGHVVDPPLLFKRVFLGEKSLENRGRRLGRPRDFCDLPIRRNEGRVVNTPLVFKRGSFSGERKIGRRKERRRKEEKNSRERERGAGLGWRKGLVRDWSGKTMNAGGVENRIWTDCTGLA
ncbi:hypothetical protein TNCV_63371 [Trichonephila clavipes]|nr:hypothetical protein TNCV_63371 [Trichonephila clavipes]